MACEFKTLPDGMQMILCGLPARKRCACGNLSSNLCDFPVKPRTGKQRTCDKPLCSKCRHDWTAELGRPAAPPPDGGYDLCRAHAEHLESLPPAQRHARGEQQRLF